ncbi:N-acetyllactosaminide beta-1,3-N-acetylglucosaminyltransferase 2 [Notolabrus celidotus]|uniref:N-acetyllactosaminide beta-1,3-N-acetylglucosaminyltransferase 2 n=1 Tax=Notolabrus celidotus TaxID=1203425 RepID=UPI00148FEA85|nr:N-acetyllactosaminide beta-1,3-N-acetylglucosaminyltransferase 2 [Notolabrus celidotus]XP_034565795.1 N-acetyllactosaminide beta-1,3-N-acetylglucosaminyltransferase 2 [Notolabrus celidotus]XP_034565796.1 N-acetyllactosaminide beta-1,3-N-acetylglucosaminyltransferase 2 [Notolabrus celidotus]XP_034565797.1 N-acetyllactosaminide beta-1,3-N-acetylglucosaminyltransferase 2 [Notolabrus celidotus]
MGKCCKCNSRLLCMCLLPCMMTGHLLVYIMVSIFVTISYTPPKITIHYVAPGISANSSALASHPLHPFWNLRLEDSALWNQMQHAWDRLHNPILLGNTTGMMRNPKAKLISKIEDECLSDCMAPCSVPRVHGLDSFPEQMRAFIRSMHCREYPLLINQPGLCRKNSSLDSPMLVMAIKSQMGNFENRQAIRETWGRSGLVSGESKKKGGLVRTLFLLGRQDSSTGPHPDLTNLLELENRRYGDILQWDFRDTFFNLTLKDLLFWHWLQQYCPTATFVFKGDDDVFVRTSALLDYLHVQWEEHILWRAFSNDTDMNLFVGDVINNAMPNREPSTKYYIPGSFYKGGYPPYAGGGGVVYSVSLALRLKKVSERVRLFPIDDVYLGMCLHRLGLSPSHHPGFLTFDLPEADRGNPCAYKSVLLVHRRSPNEMLMLWKRLKNLPGHC